MKHFFHLLKADILKLNEAALKKAKEVCSLTIEEWSKSAIYPFATSVQINQKHLEIQEKSTNDIKFFLKGPNEFTNPVLINLKQVKYTSTAINPIKSIYFKIISIFSRLNGH